MTMDPGPGKYVIAIWNTIARIQSVLNLSDADFAELLEVTEKEFWKLRATWASLSSFQCMKLARNLGITFEAFLTGNIDYLALSKQFNGDVDSLPEKYLVAAYSKRRTLKYILKFLTDHFGPDFKSMLLRRFQVSEAALLAEDKPINLRLSTDLLTFILDNIGNPDLVREVGRKSYRGLKDGEFGKLALAARNVPELFELALGHDGLISKFLEKNFVYRIDSMSDDEWRIIAEPVRHEVIEEIGKEHAFARAGCLIREGFMSGLPQYLGLHSLRTRTTKCVSQGDTHMLIHVEFDQRLKQSPELIRLGR